MQDTWYNLAEALGNYLWGETVKVRTYLFNKLIISEKFDALCAIWESRHENLGSYKICVNICQVKNISCQLYML